MSSEAPERTPWHPANQRARSQDPADSSWSDRCRAWCDRFGPGTDYSLRTHLKCPRCGFGFVYRTSYYHLGSDADVQNFAACADPDCQHTWDEWA